MKDKYFNPVVKPKIREIGRRRWDSMSLGPAICDGAGWYAEAPAKISRRSDVMARIRRRRDLKKMRKESRKR